jgi:arsenite methyltransferase
LCPPAPAEINAIQVKKAGFKLDDAVVFSFLNLQYDDDSYSKGHAQFVRNFVGGKEDGSASDLIEWYTSSSA